MADIPPDATYNDILAGLREAAGRYRVANADRAAALTQVRQARTELEEAQEAMRTAQQDYDEWAEALKRKAFTNDR